MTRLPFAVSTLFLATLSAAAGAETVTSFSTGVDYTSGKYGTPDTTSTLTVPFGIKIESGAATFRLSLPYVRTEGTVNRETGDAVLVNKRTESGLGDLVAGAAYNVYTSASGFGIDVGGKVKFATADKSKTLITTGKNDYALQTDLFQSLGRTTLFGTLGWSKRGDPDGVNLRDPFYTSLGASRKLSDLATIGIAYDYRQRLLRTSDPISEATLFASYRLTPSLKLQTYLIGGFSNASPDVGAGAVVNYGF